MVIEVIIPVPAKRLKVTNDFTSHQNFQYSTGHRLCTFLQWPASANSFFQRPSLRPDTFKNYEDHSKPTGGGLKTAFETRTDTNAINDSHSYHSYSQNETKGERVGRDLVEDLDYSRNCPIKSTGGLKVAYERRIVGDPGSSSSLNDDLVDCQPNSNAKNGLKAAFQNRLSSTFSVPGHSGPENTFTAHPQNTKMTMGDDNLSDFSSNSSIHDINMQPNEFHYLATTLNNVNQDNGYMDDSESLEGNYRGNYPTGHHSIHRLSQLNNKQGGNNLKTALEARIGGTMRRNLGGTNQKGVLLEKHANVIVSKMEQDDALMEDSPDAEELRRTALRDMPQCLTIKKSVREKLSKSVSKKSKRKPLSCWKMFKYRLSMSWTKLKMNITDLAYSFELWYGALKKIEGNFGTGVASFFKFLRWLFLVNLAIAIIAVSFIVIPKAAYDLPKQNSAVWSMLDVFTGEGFFTDTSMYYGFYTNEIINSSSLPYSMPYAYFFTMLSIYFVSFAVIGVSAAKSYKRSFIETEGGLKNVFANKIFCGWDYNIATKNAADLKRRAIYNELKELIADFTQKRQKETFYEKFLTRSIQFFMNFVILCLIAATAFAIWYFLNNVSTDRDTRIIIAPIFINAVMTLMPMFFSFVVKFEDYKNPKVSLYLTLARTFLLGAVTIGVLASYWLQNNSNSTCWETSLAQEFYRMIIFDFVISVLCTAVLDVILFLIYKYLRKDTNLEFDIAWNTMQIIYNQTLFWVGLVFSPLMPIVIVFKLFLTWYIRMYIVLIFCKPSAKAWRAAQTSTWFLVMTFLSVMFIGGLLGYIISYIETSKNCGPFRNYTFIYELVTLGLLQLQHNSIVWTVVLFVTKPGVIAVVLLFLCAKVYYSRAQANAQKEIVEQCRNMLLWTAKDKEYYYALISQATKGQWQYQFHEKNINPELYDPNIICFNDGGDARGATTSSQNLSNPPSGATFVPSTPISSYEMDGDNEYSRYKKYS